MLGWDQDSMAARGRKQCKPELLVPCGTCSLYVSEAGFWYLFCIWHLEIQLESIYIGLPWGRVTAGWFWLLLACFLCCLDLCKAVFGLRGSDSRQTALWGHCCYEMKGPQCSSFAFEGVHWSCRTCWPQRVAARAPLAVLWPHPSPCPCPPSLTCPSLPWSGLFSACLRGSGKPQAHLPKAKAPKHIHTWDWLLEFCTADLVSHTLIPQGLHKRDQGQVAFVRTQVKERFQMLSHFSIFCQHCLQ